jgi:hypothetical protein
MYDSKTTWHHPASISLGPTKNNARLQSVFSETAKTVPSLINPFTTNITNERTPNMTIIKPTTSTPSSPPVSKKTVKFEKTSGSAKFGSAAAAAERNSIDAPLQSMDTHRRFARRGSKTPGMLSASASRLVFDNERCFGRDNLEGVSEITLMNALHLSIQRASGKENSS